MKKNESTLISKRHTKVVTSKTSTLEKEIDNYFFKKFEQGEI